MKRRARGDDVDMEGANDDHDYEGGDYGEQSSRRSRSSTFVAARDQMFAPAQLRAVTHHVARARRETLATLAALRRARAEEDERARAAAPYPMNDVMAQAHSARMERALAQAEAAAAAAVQTLDEIMDADL